MCIDPQTLKTPKTKMFYYELQYLEKNWNPKAQIQSILLMQVLKPFVKNF